MILDAVIAISRLTKDPDNNYKESYMPNMALQAVEGNLQPADPSETAISEGIYGQTFVFFTTESGIRSGDRATVSGTGEKFTVRGVTDWSQTDLIPHFEMMFFRSEDEEVI